MTDRPIPPCVETLAKRINHVEPWVADLDLTNTQKSLLDLIDHCVAEAVRQCRPSPADCAALDAARMLIPIGAQPASIRTFGDPPPAVDRGAAMLALRQAQKSCRGVTPEILDLAIDDVLALPAPPPAPASGDAAGALQLVAAEREKQIRKWGAEHDAGHDDGELAIAAAVLAAHGTRAWVSHPDVENRHPRDPANNIATDWWCLIERHRHRRDQLVIAAALLCAEIDRLAALGGAAKEPKP